MASFKNLISNTSAQISSGGTITGDLVINGYLQVDGGGSLSFDEILEGTQVIDVTNTEAFLVRKNSDGGDVFIVDSTNTRVGIGDSTPDNTLSVYGGNKQIRMGATDSNYLLIGRNSSTGHFEMGRTCTGAADEIFFRANEASGGNISFPTGNVGIGHSNPQDTLSLSSSSWAGLNMIRADSAITSGERIGQISFVGTENSHSNFGYGARIEALATEAWTEGSAEGTKLVFYTTDNSSATLD